MVRPEPVFHLLAQVLGQRDHLVGFLRRGRASHLVVAQIPFLAERVELRNQLVVRADGVFQAQNDADKASSARLLLPNSAAPNWPVKSPAPILGASVPILGATLSGGLFVKVGDAERGPNAL